MKYSKKQKKVFNERRELLIEKLRSDEYTQTKGILRDCKGFCCLGVACDISGLSNWKKKTEDNTDSIFYFMYQGDTEGLPKKVQEYYGFASNNGNFTIKREHGYISTSLAYLNDQGKTFKEIADIIENKPKGLFVK